MKGSRLYAVLLIITAILIWLRNTAWFIRADDILPILAGLPIFYWLGRPWQVPVSSLTSAQSYFKIHHSRHNSDSIQGLNSLIGTFIASIFFPISLFLVGIAFDITLLMALGWVLGLRIWILFFPNILKPVSADLCPSAILNAKIKTTSSLNQLLIIPLFSFPWLTLDFPQIGWIFRLSGAHFTAFFFNFLGFMVQQQGTFVLVQETPISIEEACSGLNILQSLFLAGSALGYIFLAGLNRFWLFLIALFPIAWMANTLRIVFITSMAIIFGNDFASGIFHTWGSLFVVVVMFLGCWICCSLIESQKKT